MLHVLINVLYLYMLSIHGVLINFYSYENQQ
jgi:hypothetical protein